MLYNFERMSARIVLVASVLNYICFGSVYCMESVQMFLSDFANVILEYKRLFLWLIVMGAVANEAVGHGSLRCGCRLANQ